MSNLCQMCKQRPIASRARCEQCQAEIDERWATINRHHLNEIWQEGGCEAVERHELEKRTCDGCGTLNEKGWKHCCGCGVSAFDLAAKAFLEWFDGWKGDPE